MAKKQRPIFTAIQLDDLKEKLSGHGRKLAKMLQSCPTLPGFDDACTLRDAAQFLATTTLTIGHIDDTLRRLAELQGPVTVPHLDACGLEWDPNQDHG
jgi:hypothetical protein